MNVTISITWGRSCNYVPRSMVPFDFSGELIISNGTLNYLDHLHYRFVQWTQAMEIPERIFDKDWAMPSRLRLLWMTDTEPGSAGTLEGLRMSVDGDEKTEIKIVFKCTEIEFTLGQLLEKERLTFHVGEKYSGCPIEVYLGHDARKRVSKNEFDRWLSNNKKNGCILLPDDFSGGKTVIFHSMYGLELTPGGSAKADLTINEHGEDEGGDCPVRLCITENLGYIEPFAEDKIELCVKIGGAVRHVSHYFSNRLWLPKLDDIYVYIPYAELKKRNAKISISYTNGRCPVVIHRVYIGADVPTLTANLPKLPPLPAERYFHTGAESFQLTYKNGEVDFFLDVLKNEEIGDYVMIRGENAAAGEEYLTRWAEKIREYGFLSVTSGADEKRVSLLKSVLGDAYFGEHGHEISNLIYGWGDAEPKEKRASRTVPECVQSYLKRMSAYKVIGQALPMQFLDYEAGADIVMTEIPGSHATLTLCGARGAATAYGKTLWGVHAANHVTRAPLDECHVRRLKILLYQSWLFGAKIVYDEEVAFKYQHDTLYSYCDRIPTEYRNIYQYMFHYGNNIELGKPIVENGFIIGNGDVLNGGASGGPYSSRPYVWGEFGPETEAWKFNTPESGWKLTDVFLPGVWLYPVLQEREKIRLFFSGTPYGQVDIIPSYTKTDIKSRYKLLILPGWNSMTDDLYENLVEYVKNGGHLLLCSAQCSRHVTRDFLLEKRDFDLYNGGDLTELAGVVVGEVSGEVNSVCFNGVTFKLPGGVPGVDVRQNGAEVLANSDKGQPVLARNKIGKGAVTMLTVGEYFGCGALAGFNRAVIKSILDELRPDVYITGDTEDVDFHRFSYQSGERVVLVNTDWTDDGSEKAVTVHYKNITVETAVKEGKMRHLLCRDGLIIGFDVPSAVADNLTENTGCFEIELSGCGLTSFTIDSVKKINTIKTDGFEYSFDGKILTVDFKDKWNKCRLYAEYKNEDKS